MYLDAFISFKDFFNIVLICGSILWHYVAFRDRLIKLETSHKLITDQIQKDITEIKNKIFNTSN